MCKVSTGLQILRVETFATDVTDLALYHCVSQCLLRVPVVCNYIESATWFSLTERIFKYLVPLGVSPGKEEDWSVIYCPLTTFFAQGYWSSSVSIGSDCGLNC